MRILHLSWEYPPVVHGGLGRHVYDLSRAQAAAGHDVVVITVPHPDAPATQKDSGVRVVRAQSAPPTVEFRPETLLAWILGLGHDLTRAAASLPSDWRPDVVHGHDWVVAHAAASVSRLLDAPLVMTVHATEWGRHRGYIGGPVSPAIHAIEGWITNLANHVIVCSAYMADEVGRLFAVDPRSIDVIPNGIDLRQWRASRTQVARARATYAGDGPLLAYVGRLEWEKGIHTLIDAMPTLRRRFPGLRLAIAGKGGQADSLRQQAIARRVGGSVEFLGWIPQEEVIALGAAADVTVIPSLYEPFGLVCLEAAAVGTALVVADTGGLAEFVRNDETGQTFAPGSSTSLIAAISTVLNDPVRAAANAKRARSLARDDYSWESVASRTTLIYQQVVDGRGSVQTRINIPAPQ